MRKVNLPLPELGAIAATRGMLGAGAALLMGKRMPHRRRKEVGIAMLAVGILATVPLVIDLVRRLKSDSTTPDTTG